MIKRSWSKKFVASFPFAAEETVAHEILNPEAWQLAGGRADRYGYRTWRPRRERTDPAELQQLYRKLPARFPRLYEELVLSFRWADVDLEAFTLLANPPVMDSIRCSAGFPKTGNFGKP